MTIYRDEIIEAGAVVYATIYDTETSTATVEDHGSVVETRPFTVTEQERFDLMLGEKNRHKMEDESGEAVDKLVLVVENLNAITDMTNSEINANPAAIIKDVARELKTVARQANREARITSGRTEDTYTGEEEVP